MSWRPVLLYKQDGHPFESLVFSFPLLSESTGSSIHQCLRVVIDVTAAQPEQLGNYVLGRFIGSGASGLVRIAKSLTDGNPERRLISVHNGSLCIWALDEIVAVKAVDATKFRSISEIELVQDEIRALSSVKHENIVNLREVLFEDHVFYFVMDFASGGSLVLQSNLSFHLHGTSMPCRRNTCDPETHHCCQRKRQKRSFARSLQLSLTVIEGDARSSMGKARRREWTNADG